MATSVETTDRSTQSRATIEHFLAALDDADLDSAMAQTTDDVRFEDSSPAPDGEAFVGRPAVRATFEEILARSPRPVFEVEDLFVADDRAALRWIAHWADRQWHSGHLRGVAIFRLRDGLICEKLDYTKG